MKNLNINNLRDKIKELEQLMGTKLNKEDISGLRK